MKNLWNLVPKTTIALISAGILLFVSGCKQEGCTDPLSANYNPDATEDDGSCVYNDATLKLTVHHYVGTDPFSTSSTYAATDGRFYKFTTARFYVSGIEVEREDGSALALNKYLQIVGGTSEYSLGNLEADSYHGFNFSIGVDSAANHSDPTTFASTHALSASSPTFDHWSWNSGYIFLKIEGLADTTANMSGNIDGPFEIHVGSDNFLRPLQFVTHFDAASGGSPTIHVNIDWGKALDGVDLRNANTHTMDNMPLANTVISNLVTGITVD